MKTLCMFISYDSTKRKFGNGDFFLSSATIRSSRVNQLCVGYYQTSLSVRIPIENPPLSRPLSEISPRL